MRVNLVKNVLMRQERREEFPTVYLWSGSGLMEGVRWEYALFMQGGFVMMRAWVS